MKRESYEAQVLALAGTTLDLKWDDDLVASVGGKMYAVLCVTGAAAGALSFKVGGACQGSCRLHHAAKGGFTSSFRRL
jgi:predicted DNA-binding protein (MmcQ/YjbR family)